MNLLLSPMDVEDLTGKQRPTFQAKVLSAMGIPYRKRPNGSLVVLRSDVTNEKTDDGQASPELHL